MPMSALAPPDGDRDIGNRLIILQSVLIVPATVLLVLRLYVRIRIIRALGLDDLFISIATILGWVLFAFGTIAVKSGQGRHAYYLSKDQLMRFTKYVELSFPIITLATACSRLSISLFLLRIVDPGPRWKNGTLALITFITINYLGMFISSYFNCVPYQKSWNRSIPGTCWSETAQLAGNLWQGVFSIICDFTLALLPIIFLWKVRINLPRKIGICFLMGLGVVTGACAIVRTVLASRPVHTIVDPTWDSFHGAVWAGLEELFLLIAASVPAVQPLFKQQRYRQGYVPEQRSGATRLRSKTSIPYSHDIDSDDPITVAPSNDDLSLKHSKESAGDSELKMNDIHILEMGMV